MNTLATLKASAFLAWSIVTDKLQRMLTATGAVGFAVLLILLQLGFRSAYLESGVQLMDTMNGDIFIVSKETVMLSNPGKFPRARLYQAQAAPGVKAVHPILFSSFTWKNLEVGREASIRVVAFDPGGEAFLPESIRSRRAELAIPGNALIDDRSRIDQFGQLLGHAEINQISINVIGMFSIGTELTTSGTLIVGEETYYRLSGAARKYETALGLVELQPGADRSAALAALKASLPADVEVFTKQELRDREIDFWNTHSPISAIFGLGTVIGLIVGMLILYQLLFTLISDHLAEFATLKAIGYHTSYLVFVVFFLAVFLAISGYIGGSAVSALLYPAFRAITGLPFALGADRLVSMSIMTLVMCFVSGLIALRKVVRADPAEVF